jgi:hypothetical protein
MSTIEIEPPVSPSAPLVRDPDELPPDADLHDYLSLSGDSLEAARGRYCCRRRGPCSCPVPTGDDCPVCGKELCSICVSLRDRGQAPYAGL